MIPTEPFSTDAPLLLIYQEPILFGKRKPIKSGSQLISYGITGTAEDESVMLLI
jgi:hypothetical protein